MFCCSPSPHRRLVLSWVFGIATSHVCVSPSHLHSCSQDGEGDYHGVASAANGDITLMNTDAELNFSASGGGDGDGAAGGGAAGAESGADMDEDMDGPSVDTCA